MSNLREFNYRRGRHHVVIRWWRYSPWGSLWNWLWGDGALGGKPEVWLKSGHGNDECYCPDGMLMDFRLAAFNCGVWGW
jgi:hypothetical protein